MRPMKQCKDRDALALEGMHTVDVVVFHMMQKLGGGLDADEIRSFALTGLAQAIDRYNPQRNTKISTFAAPRIKGAILDGLSQNKMLPRRLARQIAFIQKSDEIMQYESANPPPQDKMEAVHLLADRLKDLACAYVTTCTATVETVADPEENYDPETIVDRKRYYEQVQKAVSELPPKQKALVTKYFYEEQSLVEIATELGHSKSWASRTLRAALKNIRRHFCTKDPPDIS